MPHLHNGTVQMGCFSLAPKDGVWMNEAQQRGGATIGSAFATTTTNDSAAHLM